MSSDLYTHQAISILNTLPLKTQQAVKYLRNNILAGLIKNGQAHVSNNTVHPVEYWNEFPTYQIKLYYYEEYSNPFNIVIFRIDHITSNHNGHGTHP